MEELTSTRCLVEPDPLKEETKDVDEVGSTTQPSVPTGHTLRVVGGHSIVFPGKPYSVQLQYMEHVVRALDAPGNALLEAPTGVGKTLALICAAMQWMEDERQTYTADRSDLLLEIQRCSDRRSGVSAQTVTHPDSFGASISPYKECFPMEAPKHTSANERPCVCTHVKSEEKNNGSATEMETMWSSCRSTGISSTMFPKRGVFQRDSAGGSSKRTVNVEHRVDPSLKRFRTNEQDPSLQVPPKVAKTASEGDYVKVEADLKLATYGVLFQDEVSNQETTKANDRTLETPHHHREESIGSIEQLARMRPPRIFYATRTHSQITQVVHEIRKTRYRPNVAVLASRRHYCIHKNVKNEKVVDEACRRQRKFLGCKYLKNTNKKSTNYEWPIQDIEELKMSCEENSLCPYYLSRNRMERAELVLTPYNYLISPTIRNIVEIDVREAGIIFDEAHNIEDICREAASFESNLEAIFKAQQCCRIKKEHYDSIQMDSIGWACSVLEEDLRCLTNLLSRFLPSREMHRLLIDLGADCKEIVFNATETLRLIEEAGLDTTELRRLDSAFEKIERLDDPRENIEHRGEKEEDNDHPDESNPPPNEG